MIFNGPPHDWIESDDRPSSPRNEPEAPRFLQDAWTNLHPWTPIDVAQRNMVQSIGRDLDLNVFHSEDNHPVGRLVTQTIGGLNAPAFLRSERTFRYGTASAVDGQGGIAVRSFTRQEQSLHRWKPVITDRLALLMHRARTQHPNTRLRRTCALQSKSSITSICARALEKIDDETVDAPEEVLPLQLPSPLLSPRPYDPTTETNAFNDIFTSAVG